MQVQGVAALREESLINRPQPCWLLAASSPDFSQHLCSSNLSSHASFSLLPYNSTASFPQNPKQGGLKSFLSGSAAKCPGQMWKLRGDCLIPAQTSVIGAAVCQTKWSDLVITSGHEDPSTEGGDGNPCRKLAKHFLKIPDLQFSKTSQAENCPEKY